MPSEDVQAALDRAFRYLGHRDRTVAEIEKYLIALEFLPNVTREAVEELKRLGYLDDQKFAKRFAEDRRTLDGWGTERICTRLRDLGVDSEIARTAAFQESESEMDRALEFLQTRFTEGICGDRERQRALGLLVRRGYESELAYEAVRKVTVA